ncbi:uncharacterized protein BDZ83DRAFT_418584 [Colletotrichum acutatum]|uniref:Uncharacterized protein n=1 Tax=Glomerella acutata TaxID=27357 RepID=A0AAD8UIW5_GLOAC|nr:uncharacterized protein BDZ83DRAFT_418584 [Colletotrichum acutatum]KAK1722540.1 hypothetical protein BDZ83DRAFT_418584 [Colletotrichum acutatum]
MGRPCFMLLCSNRHVPFWVFYSAHCFLFRLMSNILQALSCFVPFPPYVSVVYFVPPTFSIIPAPDAMSSVINECTLSRSLYIPPWCKAHTHVHPSPSLDVSPPTNAPITTLSLSPSAKDLPTCGPVCPGPGKAPRKCQAPKRREPPPTLPYSSAWVPLVASDTTMILAKTRDMPRCARVRKPSPPPGVS